MDDWNLVQDSRSADDRVWTRKVPFHWLATVLHKNTCHDGVRKGVVVRRSGLIALGVRSRTAFMWIGGNVP